MTDDHAADHQSERGSGFGAEVDQTVGESAMLFGKSLRDDLRIGGIGDGFTDAQQEPQGEDGDESRFYETGEGGGG